MQAGGVGCHASGPARPWLVHAAARTLMGGVGSWILRFEQQPCWSLKQTFQFSYIHECKLMWQQPSGLGLQDGLDEHFHRAILKKHMQALLAQCCN